MLVTHDEMFYHSAGTDAKILDYDWSREPKCVQSSSQTEFRRVLYSVETKGNLHVMHIYIHTSVNDLIRLKV